MKNNSRARLTAALASVLLSASARAGTFLYTNSPCVYLLVSNSVSQTATLLGPTGSLTGSVTVDSQFCAKLILFLRKNR